MACRLCLECGGTRQHGGRGDSSGGSRDRWHRAGADGACACWMQPHCQMAQAAPAPGESNEPSCLLPQGFGDSCLRRGGRGDRFPGGTEQYTNPLRSSQTLGFVPSLGSHSHDPVQSRASSQFHLFIWQRWWVQSIPSECLKSLLSSPLPLQRLQEVSRNLDSASPMMVSDSILRKSQEGSLGPGIACGQVKATMK